MFRSLCISSLKPIYLNSFLRQPVRICSGVASNDLIEIIFIEHDERKAVKGKLGDNLLNVAKQNKIDLEGACGGELSCSTCHVVLEEEIYNRIPPKKEEEEDMLDLAWGLTETSRLGCQVKLEKFMEGTVIIVPEESNNMMPPVPQIR